MVSTVLDFDLYVCVCLCVQLKNGEKMMSGKTPDLFSFVITGLKSVSDSHGPDSDQAKDAHHMVSQFIDMVRINHI